MWLRPPHLIIALMRELPLISAGLFRRFKAPCRGKNGVWTSIFRVSELLTLSHNESLLEGVGLATISVGGVGVAQ